MSQLRVHKFTYESFESQLLRTITSGAPPTEVCEAARALIENCFTRRSAAEWLIDSLPKPLLPVAEKLSARRARNERTPVSSSEELLPSTVSIPADLGKRAR